MNKMRFKEEDLSDFLQELINAHRFNDSKEEGIAKRVIDKGYESLTDKQKFVFENAIEPYVFQECARCGDDIPWCEMSAAEDNGGKCSWCQQLGRNDDK